MSAAKTRRCRYCNGTGREPVSNRAREWISWWLVRHRDGSQAGLARLMEVDQSTVSTWHTGRREPDKFHRIRLCKALGITEAQYFDGPPRARRGAKR